MAQLKFMLILLLVYVSICANSQVIAPVKVAQAKIQAISKIVKGHGVIQPYPQDDAKISTVSPMRIEAIIVKPGDHVQKGQLVIKLQRDQSIDVAVEKATISLKQAKLNLERAKNLFKNGVIPKVKYEQAQTEYNLAEANYLLKKRALDYAIQNSEICSPIEGYVSSVRGAVGQISNPSQQIIRIVNIKKMIAFIGIEIEDIGKIHANQAAEITIPNLPDHKTFPGKVVKINKEIDPTTQLIHIWINLNNDSELLQPGMFAEAQIFIKTEPNALVVKKSAVLKDDKGTYLFVIKNKTARKIYVKTGIQSDTVIQILAGIQKGQKVVWKGNYELENGMRVVIKK